MKTIIQLIFLLLTFPMLVNGQITLEQCQQKARENYPMVKQFDLIEQTRQYNISNASKGYLPQGSVSVKATYQSDVWLRLAWTISSSRHSKPPNWSPKRPNRQSTSKRTSVRVETASTRC